MVVLASFVDLPNKNERPQQTTNHPFVDTNQALPTISSFVEEKAPAQSYQVPSSTEITPYRAMYECPISRHIMAEPVVASDGYLYDRPEIEEWFRIRADSAAQAAASSDDDSVCCGAQRGNIGLASPVMGQSINGVLTPVYPVEQLIQRGVETNAFQMTPDELADWRVRRESKLDRAAAAAAVTSQQDPPMDDELADATSYCAPGMLGQAESPVQIDPQPSVLDLLVAPFRQAIRWQSEQHQERCQLKRRRQTEERRRAAELGLTEEYERRQLAFILGDARKCAKCGAGPIVKEGCNNMRTHNYRSRNQRRGSNACPSCGHFAKKWTDNPPFYESGGKGMHSLV